MMMKKVILRSLIGVKNIYKFLILHSMIGEVCHQTAFQLVRTLIVAE